MAGNATFNRATPGNLIVNQSSPRAIINWSDFSIGAGELTKFIQPSATAVALNRVIGGNLSQIYGTLQGNGQVYVINPSGILVGPQGQINTRGFLASTLDVRNADFMAGADLRLSGNSTAAVNNQGAIEALGGDVFLIARTVENSGSIHAAEGVAGLAAGSEVLLTPAGNERLSVLAGNPNAARAGIGVNNLGDVRAAAVELKAAGGNIYALAINNGGIVRADSAVNENGRIVLRASGGNIQNSGTLAAHNADGSGGSIVVDGGHNADNPATVVNSGTLEARGEVSGSKGGQATLLGDHVGLFGEAVVDVSGDAGGGTALIGGDYQGKNPAIPNAQAAFVSPDARIKADALTLGNGGKVVVWSEASTRFYGSISARGGAQGGNGGSVETSGHFLDFRGTVSTLAPLGTVGRLLLDPTDLTIDNLDQNINAATPFIPTASPSHLSWATIDTALGGGAVTVTTVGSPNSGVEAGNITIAAASPALNRNNKLTLNAAGAITVNSGSTIMNSGTGDLELDAVGTVTIDAGITLKGNLSVSGAGISSSAALVVNGALKTATFAAGSGSDITLGNAANDFTTVAITSGRNVTLNDVNKIDLGASTISGTLGVTAAGPITQSGALAVTGASSFAAGANGITLSNPGNTFGGAVTVNNSGANDVALRNASDLTVGGSVRPRGRRPSTLWQ